MYFHDMLCMYFQRTVISNYKILFSFLLLSIALHITTSEIYLHYKCLLPLEYVLPYSLIFRQSTHSDSQLLKALHSWPTAFLLALFHSIFFPGKSFVCFPGLWSSLAWQLSSVLLYFSVCLFSLSFSQWNLEALNTSFQQLNLKNKHFYDVTNSFMSFIQL